MPETEEMEEETVLGTSWKLRGRFPGETGRRCPGDGARHLVGHFVENASCLRAAERDPPTLTTPFRPSGEPRTAC